MPTPTTVRMATERIFRFLDAKVRGMLSRVMAVSFDAQEHRDDGGFATGRFRFHGSPADGWQIERNGRPHLSLGPGYSLLSVRACGVCATDLARRFLPFPLPQVIGHELLATDAQGRRFVVEINASCRARGTAPCPRCRSGLDHHCRQRRVLGIHDLPGGFGPFVLAPVHAALPVPDSVSDETAVLVEPLAAALHAVRTVAIRDGDRVAVLGPRRLGMLVIAALAAERRRGGRDFEIAAVVRRPALAALARALGADVADCIPPGELPPPGSADVVFDTTGTPDGLAGALVAARRELHLKSTHGQAAGGLRHLTGVVVDELGFAPLSARAEADRPLWWDGGASPSEDPSASCGTAAECFAQLGPGAVGGAVVADAAAADAAIRPDPTSEDSLLRPGGRLFVHPRAGDSAAPLLRQVARRGLRVSSSRCGDFRAVLDLLAKDPGLREIGPRLISHRFGPDRLARAFEVAASSEALKLSLIHI